MIKVNIKTQVSLNTEQNNVNHFLHMMSEKQYYSYWYLRSCDRNFSEKLYYKWKQVCSEINE